MQHVKIESGWYQDHVAHPAANNPNVRRGRAILSDKPEGRAAITMAKELELLEDSVSKDEIPFTTYIGIMQVTAFAVGIAQERHGDIIGPFLPDDLAAYLSTTYNNYLAENNFSPSGDAQRDIWNMHVIIGGQTQGLDTDHPSFDHYREGVQFGLARWQELVAS